MIDRIRRHEGFRAQPYQDTLGNWTVGWGHRLGPGPIPPDDVPTTVEELEILFIRDLNEAVNGAGAVVRRFEKPVSPGAFAVVVEMVFNLGYKNLSEFKKFQQALSEGDYWRAAEEMLNSRWADQVGARAHELAERMRSVKSEER